MVRSGKPPTLLGGPAGQGISALTLLHYHKGTAERGRQKCVRFPSAEKWWQTIMFDVISAVWSRLVELLFRIVISEAIGLF